MVWYFQPSEGYTANIAMYVQSKTILSWIVPNFQKKYKNIFDYNLMKTEL